VKILIADDSIVSRHLLEATLRKWGYDVLVACDGVEALDLLQREDAPALAILDWMMPGLTGLEVCRRIRADPRYRRLPILILTGADHSSDVGEVVGLGLIWYLRKGADWQLIMRTLRNLVTRAREMAVAS